MWCYLLHCAVMWCVVMWCDLSVFVCGVLYCMLCCTMLGCNALCHVVLWCDVIYCTVLLCDVLCYYICLVYGDYTIPYTGMCCLITHNKFRWLQVIITLFEGYENVSLTIVLTLFHPKYNVISRFICNILRMLKCPVFLLWFQCYLNVPFY